jgi:hypothetical protein
MAIAFVTPETVKLPLSDEQWILVKKRLTHGEHDAMMARVMPHLTPGEKMQVDSKGARAIRVAAYLIGWSASVPMSADLSEQDKIDTLNALEPASFDEIETVINRHEQSVAAGTTRPFGGSASETTSNSAG